MNKEYTQKKKKLWITILVISFFVYIASYLSIKLMAVNVYIPILTISLTASFTMFSFMKFIEYDKK
jgi:hypothetical protein